MLKNRCIFFILLITLLGSCSSPPSEKSETELAISESSYAITSTQPESDKTLPSTPAVVTPNPSPTPTPDPFADLYGCEMELEFISGSLESRKTRFTILGKDYFKDKGDLFDPGTGTSIYYESQHYFIVHSSYVNGNILDPMEAEFIRKYLEYWGDTGPEYIQDQINSLEGSRVVWKCSGKEIFLTRINGIVRLSHEASNRLWLEPRSLEQIIEDREGLVSEWIGEFKDTDQPILYIGFCGWGPRSLGDSRFTYYRYLIKFDVLNNYS